MEEIHTVTLGSGLVEALQLDDEGVRNIYPIAITKSGRFLVQVTGSRAALEHLRRDCVSWSGFGSEWNGRLARFTANAAKSLDKFLAKIPADLPPTPVVGTSSDFARSLGIDVHNFNVED